MAGKYSNWNQCGKKKRYRSSSDANRVIRKRSQEIDYKLDWYECPYCKGYHITKAMDFYEYIQDKYNRKD